jgi:HK97 gp10 family phage protein
MKVTITGLDELNVKLAKISQIADGANGMDALEAGGRVIQAYAQENIRTKLNKHPKGFLVSQVDVRREGNSILVGLWGVVYAAIHEFGGMIVAKTAKALRFQIDGKWIFTKKVMMPARPYLRPAVDEHLDEIRNAIADTINGLLERFNI